ncbi:MAG: CopG family transcriptional regulator [Thermoprotei archaeon]
MGDEKIKVEISLSKELYEKALAKAREAGFGNFGEFVEFLIEQVVEETTESVELTPEEEEKVKERLRALGYLD